MRAIVFLLLILLALVASPARAADVHHCIGADGNAIFTDKKCEDIGAQTRQEPAPQNAGTTEHLAVRGCARTLESLRDGLKTAIYSNDVNHLASFYNWPGISSAQSVSIMKRLQTILDRPLTSIQLAGAAQPRDADGFRIVASEQPTAHASAIEIVQALSATNPTEVRTEFALIQNAGCWWVQF